MTVATPAPDTSTPTLVLDIPESAALLRCGRTTLYELIAGGEITGIKIGRRRLITYESLAAYVARQASVAQEGLPVREGDAQFEEAS